jgi:hypothetical protein
MYQLPSSCIQLPATTGCLTSCLGYPESAYPANHPVNLRKISDASAIPQPALPFECTITDKHYNLKPTRLLCMQIKSAAEKLQGQGVGAVLVKLGAQGSLLLPGVLPGVYEG